MNSSFSSSEFSQNKNFNITQEEFYAFHNIDRKYFIRLVFGLKRDPIDVMQAIALWLWLERVNKCQYISLLIKLSDTMFEIVYEETLLCLRVVVTNELIVYPNNNEVIPTIKNIVGQNRNEFNLYFFKENRMNIIAGVDNFIQEVCLRAFHDLIQTLINSRSIQTDINGQNYRPPFLSSLCSVSRESPFTGGNRNRSDVIGQSVGSTSQSHVIGQSIGSTSQSPLYMATNNHNSGDNKGLMIYFPNLRAEDVNIPLKLKGHLNVVNPNTFQGGASSSSNNVPMHFNKNVGNNAYVLEEPPQIPEVDLVEQLIAQMRLNEDPRFQRVDENNVPPSERTIFLTFSKGYPISEQELREFLNRLIFLFYITFFIIYF